MSTLFMNSKSSQTCDSHRVSLHLREKTDLKRKGKYITLSNLIIYYTCKSTKNHIRKINKNTQLQQGMENVSYLMDHNLNLRLFWIHIKKHKEKIVNPY